MADDVGRMIRTEKLTTPYQHVLTQPNEVHFWQG